MARGALAKQAEMREVLSVTRPRSERSSFDDDDDDVPLTFAGPEELILPLCCGHSGIALDYRERARVRH